MCGRYSIYAARETLEDEYGIPFETDYHPKYNAAPSQILPVITSGEPDIIQLGRWGLKPVWMKKKGGLINIREDSLAQKPVLKHYLNRRCLVLANCYFDWKPGDISKTPYKIGLKDREIFAFAGLWHEETIDEIRMITYSIVTTDPNEANKEIHNRMPVILRKEDEEPWLSDDTSGEEAQSFLHPYESEDMDIVEISKSVNNPKNNTAEILEAA